MSTVSISPPPGLNSDDTSFTTPGLWADANWMRFRDGKAETEGGYADALGELLTGVCRNVLIWADRTGSRNVAFGTHSKLMVSAGGTLADITPAGLAAGSIHGAGGPGYGADAYNVGTYGENVAQEWFARTWSLATFGDFLYANPRNKGIYLWENDPAVPAAVLANAPTQVYSILVTPERQLLAFGCNEEASGTFNAMAIRGSGIDGQHTIWDTTNSVYRPFEHILDGGSYIAGAGMVGSYVAVWTDTSLHLGQYVGALDQAYRFDPVGSGCGLIGPNAVQVINGTAYWITPDYQVMGWALGGKPQPIKCPILDDFRDNVVRSQKEKIVATSINQFGEVRWFYPDARDGLENSRYISLSLVDGAWSRGNMARTAATDAGAADNPLFVAPDGTAYWHENGDTANGGALTWRIRTSDMYIGNAEQRGLIKGIWPDFKSQRGPVFLTIHCRDYPQGPVAVEGPFPLAAGQPFEDFLVDTRIAAFEFSGSSAPAFVRFGKPMIDVVGTGRR